MVLKTLLVFFVSIFSLSVLAQSENSTSVIDREKINEFRDLKDAIVYYKGVRELRNIGFAPAECDLEKISSFLNKSLNKDRFDNEETYRAKNKNLFMSGVVAQRCALVVRLSESRDIERGTLFANISPRYLDARKSLELFFSRVTKYGPAIHVGEYIGENRFGASIKVEIFNSSQFEISMQNELYPSSIIAKAFSPSLYVYLPIARDKASQIIDNLYFICICELSIPFIAHDRETSKPTFASPIELRVETTKIYFNPKWVFVSHFFPGNYVSDLHVPQRCNNTIFFHPIGAKVKKC